MVKLFFNKYGRIRSIWKLILFTGGFLLLSVILSLLISPLWGWETFQLKEGRVIIKPNEWAIFLASLLVSLTSVKYLDKRPLGSLGLKFYAAWWKELFIGISLGALLQFFILALILALERPSFKVALALDFQQLLLTMINYFRNAVSEELLFRGFPLQVLLGGIGVTPAILATSVLFGLAHEEHGWLGMVTAGSGGVLMAAGYLKTRALWMPIGIHFAWNYSYWVLYKIFEFDPTWPGHYSRL